MAIFNAITTVTFNALAVKRALEVRTDCRRMTGVVKTFIHICACIASW